MCKKANLALLLAIAGIIAGLFIQCDKKEKSLIVYSGKGLKNAMEDVKEAFEQKHKQKISIIYAGSSNLLETIQKTKKGDVFIPGSVVPVKMAETLVAHSQSIATHKLTFAVRTDNPKNIKSYKDLSRPGIRIAAGNKEMCAAGTVAEKIMTGTKDVEFAKNITITGSTVNALIDLVVQKEVDASLIWADMLTWPEAGVLKMVEIPSDINKTQEIPVAVLTTTTDRKSADLFADFVVTEGRSIFVKHGFGEIK